MALYDLYEEYRDPQLTPRERRVLEGAAGLGGPLPPETTAHIAIAMARAERQFQGYPPMPEHEDTAIRFPGVDPVGKYSVIDMKLAQRHSRVDAALQVRSPQTRQLVRSIQRAAQRPELRQLFSDVQTAAQRHRTLTRASKLCLDSEGRRALHRQARSLETGEAVLRYDLFLQGLEHAAGVKRGPLPQDVAEFYGGQLQMPLPPAALDQAGQLVRPRELAVEFPSFEHRLLQVQFSDPRNWGRPAAGLDPAALDQDALLPSYAAAAAERTLAPLFPTREGDSPDRTRLIRIDGTPLHALLEGEGISGPAPQQIRELSAQHVSAALMAGRKVDVLLPGQTEPVPLVRTGYQPTPERAAAWTRYCARQGFDREPPAKAAPEPRPGAMTK